MMIEDEFAQARAASVHEWDAFIAESRDGILFVRTFDGPEEARQTLARELYQNLTGAAQDIRSLGWMHPRLPAQLAALDALAGDLLTFL